MCDPKKPHFAHVLTRGHISKRHFLAIVGFKTATDPDRTRCKESASSPSRNRASPGLNSWSSACWAMGNRSSMDADGANRDWMVLKMKVSSSTRLADATELSSLFMVRRGVSMTTQSGPLALSPIVFAPSKLNSPKNWPANVKP